MLTKLTGWFKNSENIPKDHLKRREGLSFVTTFEQTYKSDKLWKTTFSALVSKWIAGLQPQPQPQPPHSHSPSTSIPGIYSLDGVCFFFLFFFFFFFVCHKHSLLSCLLV
jgi:hypothetical protein